MTFGISLALGVAMLAVLLALFGGLYTMTRGSKFAQKHGNRFMRARVMFQALAIVLFLLLLFARQ